MAQNAPFKRGEFRRGDVVCYQRNDAHSYWKELNGALGVVLELDTDNFTPGWPRIQWLCESRLGSGWAYDPALLVPTGQRVAEEVLDVSS